MRRRQRLGLRHRRVPVRDLSELPDEWSVVRLGDVVDVAFSGVDKKTIDGEIPIQLCNYTDVFYNRLIHSGMRFMKATATPKECNRWSLKQGDVLFTKDSETPDELGIPAFVTENMPTVLCGYHLGMARPRAKVIDGQFLAEALGSQAAPQGVCQDSERDHPIWADAGRNAFSTSLAAAPLGTAGHCRRAGRNRRGHRAYRGGDQRHGATVRRSASRVPHPRRPGLAHPMAHRARPRDHPRRLAGCPAGRRGGGSQRNHSLSKEARLLDEWIRSIC